MYMDDRSLQDCTRGNRPAVQGLRIHLFERGDFL